MTFFPTTSSGEKLAAIPLTIWRVSSPRSICSTNNLSAFGCFSAEIIVPTFSSTFVKSSIPICSIGASSFFASFYPPSLRLFFLLAVCFSVSINSFASIRANRISGFPSTVCPHSSIPNSFRLSASRSDVLQLLKNFLQRFPAYSCSAVRQRNGYIPAGYTEQLPDDPSSLHPCQAPMASFHQYTCCSASAG